MASWSPAWRHGAASLQSYLFGSITTIDVTDVLVTMVLAAIVVVTCVGLSPQLFAVAQDQDFARVAGLNVRAYNILIAVLAAVSVTVAMRTVGLLLVSALMVVPVATAQQLTRSFRTTLTAAMALGVAASLGGLLTAAFAPSDANVAPGSDHRAARPRRVRGHVADRRLAPPAPAADRAVPGRPRTCHPSTTWTRGPPARSRTGLRPCRGPARRPRRLRPRRPPPRRPRGAL